MRILLVLLNALAVNACNYEAAAQAMFSGSCDALVASQPAFCTNAHVFSPFIGYFCGASCGTASTYMSTYPDAYGPKDLDGLFQKVEQYGKFSPTSGYSLYNNYGDEDPTLPGKQVYYNCSELATLAPFWGTTLSSYCTQVISTICPKSYDAICVPAGFPAKATKSRCPDFACANWCNEHTCGMSSCQDCKRLDTNGCGADPYVCDAFCNAHTCGSPRCAGCADCKAVAANTYCAWWCNVHTSPGGLFPFTHCNGCSF